MTSRTDAERLLEQAIPSLVQGVSVRRPSAHVAYRNPLTLVLDLARHCVPEGTEHDLVTDKELEVGSARLREIEEPGNRIAMQWAIITGEQPLTFAPQSLPAQWFGGKRVDVRLAPDSEHILLRITDSEEQFDPTHPSAALQPFAAAAGRDIQHEGFPTVAYTVRPEFDELDRVRDHQPSEFRFHPSGSSVGAATHSRVVTTSLLDLIETTAQLQGVELARDDIQMALAEQAADINDESFFARLDGRSRSFSLDVNDVMITIDPDKGALPAVHDTERTALLVGEQIALSAQVHQRSDGRTQVAPPTVSVKIEPPIRDRAARAKEMNRVAAHCDELESFARGRTLGAEELSRRGWTVDNDGILHHVDVASRDSAELDSPPTVDEPPVDLALATPTPAADDVSATVDTPAPPAADSRPELTASQPLRKNGVVTSAPPRRPVSRGRRPLTLSVDNGTGSEVEERNPPAYRDRHVPLLAKRATGETRIEEATDHLDTATVERDIPAADAHHDLERGGHHL